MSCSASSYVQCATLQSDLTNYFATCGAELIREPMPFVEFLLSPVNTNGLQQVISPGNGKIRSVELKYQARIPESQVTENDSDLCSCSTTRGNCSQVYTLDPSENLSICETITASTLRTICEPNGEFVMRKITHMVDALERRQATELVQEASFLTGSWVGNSEVPNINGSDQLVVKTKKDGDAFTVNPFAMSEIDFALSASGYCAPSPIFGGRELYQYYRNMQAGCCSDSGNDLSAHLSLYGRAVAYDPRVAATFSGGQNAGIVLQPGAVAVITWNEFGWSDGMPLSGNFKEGANYSRSLIVSPRLGLPMDVIVKDECPGTLTITISVVAKLVNLPSDIFPVGDKYRGVNFFNEILVTNV